MTYPEDMARDLLLIVAQGEATGALVPTEAQLLATAAGVLRRRRRELDAALEALDAELAQAARPDC